MTITINGTTGISGVDGSAATPAFKGNDSNTGISFGTDIVTINTGGTARVTTDASGNVGIGTSAPAVRLDVAGGSIQVDSGTGGSYAAFNSTNANGGYATFSSSGTVHGDIGTASQIVSGGSTSDFGINARGSRNLIFGTANTERMRIDSSGNVGIGVTPSAWATGGQSWRVLEASRDAAFGGAAGGSVYAFMSSNCYATGSDSPASCTWRYKLTGSNVGLYQQLAGQHIWSTAGSGTAGNAISFSQKMLLDSSVLSVNGVITTDNQGTSSAQIRAVNSGGTFYQGIDANTGGSFGSTYAAVLWHSGNYAMLFATNNQERMRISADGFVGIGAIPVNDSKFYVSSNTAGVFAGTFANFSASGYGVSIGSTGTNLAIFYPTGSRAGGGVGAITHNGTNTTYGTSSDYRLKNITGDLTESGAFIDALKPKVGTWKSNGAPFVGFLAHEFQEVSPSSVTGEKDKVDEKGEPEYQVMQASSAEVMANIIAELQSLRKRVAELENK